MMVEADLDRLSRTRLRKPDARARNRRERFRRPLLRRRRCAATARRGRLRRPARRGRRLSDRSRDALAAAASRRRARPWSSISPRRPSFPRRCVAARDLRDQRPGHRAARAGGARLLRPSRRRASSSRVRPRSTARAIAERVSAARALDSAARQSVRREQGRGRSDLLAEVAAATDSTSSIARAFNHIGPRPERTIRRRLVAAQLARIAGGASAAALRRQPRSGARLSRRARRRRGLHRARARRRTRRDLQRLQRARPSRFATCLRELITIARVPVEVREDPERMRARRDAALGRQPREAARDDRLGAARFRSSQSLRDVYEAASKLREQSLNDDAASVRLQEPRAAA